MPLKIWISAWLIITLLGSQAYSKECGLANYPDLEEIDSFLIDNPIKILQFETKKNKNNRDFNLIKQEEKETRTTLNAKMAVARQFYETTSTDKDIELNLSTNLSFWDTPARKKLLRVREDISDLSKEELKVAYRHEILTKTVSYLSLNLLIDIYKERTDLIDQSLAYAAIKQENGATSSFEIASLNTQLVEITNKLNAARQKQETTLLDFAKKDGFFSDLSLTLRLKGSNEIFDCGNNSLELRKYKLLNEKAKVETTLVKLAMLPTLSSAIITSTNLDGTDDATIGLNLDIPIYSGGVKRTALEKSYNALKDSQDDILLSEQNDDKVTAERQAIDALLLASIQILRSRVQDKEIELTSFKEREILGQSIFEELNSIRSEINTLSEALVNSTQDLYLGWLDYLKYKGIL